MIWPRTPTVSPPYITANRITRVDTSIRDRRWNTQPRLTVIRKKLIRNREASSAKRERRRAPNRPSRVRRRGSRGVGAFFSPGSILPSSTHGSFFRSDLFSTNHFEATVVVGGGFVGVALLVILILFLMGKVSGHWTNPCHQRGESQNSTPSDHRRNRTGGRDRHVRRGTAKAAGSLERINS